VNGWQGIILALTADSLVMGCALGALGGEVVRPRQPGPPPPQGYYQPDYGPQCGRPGYRPPPPSPNYSSRPPVTAPNQGNGAPPGAGDYYSQTPSPQPDGCRAPMTYVPYYY
jgi:hypothetical protein